MTDRHPHTCLEFKQENPLLTNSSISFLGIRGPCYNYSTMPSAALNSLDTGQLSAAKSYACRLIRRVLAVLKLTLWLPPPEVQSTSISTTAEVRSTSTAAVCVPDLDKILRNPPAMLLPLPALNSLPDAVLAQILQVLPTVDR